MRVRLLIAIVLAAVVVAPWSSPRAAGSVAPSCADADLRPTAETMPRARTAMLCLLNHQRTDHGRPRLRAVASLREAATGYARLMVDRGFFDHTSPGGSTMVSRVRATSYLSGAVGWSLGENLAWGSGALATPEAAVEEWMDSPAHRANVLDPRFRDVGIGVARGAPDPGAGRRNGATYVADFGRRVLP